MFKPVGGVIEIQIICFEIIIKKKKKVEMENMTPLIKVCLVNQQPDWQADLR